MTKEGSDKIVSELKKSQKRVICEFLEKERKKTDQEIQNEIEIKNEFKNKHPDLFTGTIFEQILKRLNFEKATKNE
jgi:hypothetical protein